MAGPGSDFLDSLSQLFSEAGSKGRDGKIEFAHLRGILIKFVTACSRMTAAKARASHNLQFVDGTEPQTLLALPPGKLRIDDKMRAQLETTTTGDEFIEILRDLITKQVSPRRRSPRGHKNKSPVQTAPESPKSKAQQRAEAAQKNKKQPVRIKLRRSGERPGTDEKAQKIQAQTKPAETAKESRPVVVTQQAPPQPIPEPHRAHNLPGPMDVDANDDDSSEGFASSESSDTSSSEDQSITYSDNGGDTQMGGAVVPKIEDSAQRRPHISEVTAVVAQFDGEGVETFKAKMFDMLARIEADPTDEEVVAALKRLEQAVIKTKPERQFIPDRTWQKYHTKLVKEAKKGWFEKNWDDRIWRIGRICFLKEEEVVIVDRNWDRLRAAARLSALLTEMTAPPQEPNKRAAIDKWLVEKLENVAFLERALNSRDRISAIHVP
ncbi:hypothetical protein N0V84_009619 [Fusarium piperis]|uniref:Uncharacterized protein n=1 Tax=Fusarium piperis TaxID=1435070 RepID=A0A9W9BK63_9HYPO|nr:hypothetical protein N0V84_009619 [Fusarium piperis]